MIHRAKDSKLQVATYGEWEASIFGACFVAFGLGVLTSRSMGSIAPWAILIGAIAHGWGMYRIYQRNK